MISVLIIKRNWTGLNLLSSLNTVRAFGVGRKDFTKVRNKSTDVEA